MSSTRCAIGAADVAAARTSQKSARHYIDSTKWIQSRRFENFYQQRAQESTRWILAERSWKRPVQSLTQQSSAKWHSPDLVFFLFFIEYRTLYQLYCMALCVIFSHPNDTLSSSILSRAWQVCVYVSWQVCVCVMILYHTVYSHTLMIYSIIE